MTVISFPVPKPAPKEPFVEQYSRAEAAKLFGLTPQAELTPEQKVKAKEVNDALDALAYHTGIHDLQLCMHTYGDNEKLATEALYGYLNNVSACPQSVLDEAERLIKLRHEQELAKTQTP